MYKIVMVSGPVKHDFQGGFDTELAAYKYAEEYNFRWYDEAGFEWRLEIEEDEEQIIENCDKQCFHIPNKEWARTFLEFRTHGDDQALLYLMDVMENTFNRALRLQYAPLRRLVDSLYALNYVIAAMEMDEIPHNAAIEESYRNLMQELADMAENS